MNTNNFYIIVCASNEADSGGLSETLIRYVAFSKSRFMYSGPAVNMT